MDKSLASDTLKVWLHMDDTFKNRNLLKLAFLCKKIKAKRLARYFVNSIDVDVKY